MKISLEFEDENELRAFIYTKAKEFVAEELESSKEVFHIGEPGAAIESTHRRKYWAEVEVQFVKDYYMIKKVPWIAKQLRRKKADVSAKLAQMYKKGLPKKYSRNGKIREDD